MNITSFIVNLYGSLLRRNPSHNEILAWTNKYLSGHDCDKILKDFIESDEYLRLSKANDLLFVTPGHFYSPIVDSNLENLALDFNYSNPIAGIHLSPEEQCNNWNSLLPFLNKISFNLNKISGSRYFSDNPSYGIGDASIYGAMLLKNQPKNIIEIGSGNSSACMLDVLDQLPPDSRPSITFVEPFPDLLKSILKPEDFEDITLYDVGVQKISTSLFSSLDENDILFIDSTHILKTGSDVCWELFEILPSLKPGVLIHFHDVFWPFEYPDSWIFREKRSWNEIYGLKAFLMYNSQFQIEFFNDYFAKNFKEKIRNDCPKLLQNTGGSLWIRKLV